MIPGSRLVLYVEDDADDQIIFKECLQHVRPDLECQFAKDAFEALDLLKSGKISPICIFIDVNMPGMNGNELLSEIKAINALCEIPCYMLSTSKNLQHRQQAIACGAQGYLIKPAIYIDFQKLLEVTMQNV